MPVCTQLHIVKKGNKPVKLEHYYIAGNCVHDPCVQGGFLAFLKGTHPYHHGRTYQESLKEHETIVSV